MTVIHPHFRQALIDEAAIADAEAERQLYTQITYDEDFLTAIDITRRVEVLAEAGDVFRFGRNEMGNQNLHTWVDKLLADCV